MDTAPIWSYIIDSAESVFTIVAIAIAGIFAWRNGIIFRHRSPHIDITHEVTHRAISDRYNHLAVTVNLHNSSNVKVEFRDGLFVLQHLAPMPDEEVEYLYDSASAYVYDEGMNVIQWDTLEEIWSAWNKDELSVEPGQTVAHTVDFLVPWDVESVLVTTYMFNSKTMGKINNNFVNPDDAPKQRNRLLRWREVEGPRGWTRITAHDILLEETEQPDFGQG